MMKTKKPKALYRVLFLALSFIAIFGLYQALCALHIRAVVYVYAVVLTVLVIVFYFLHAGLDREMPDRDMLPKRWSDEKKDAFLNALPRRREIARRLLYLIVPLLLTFAIDLIYLRFFSGICGA